VSPHRLAEDAPGLGLTAWFRARMAPLVATTGIVVTLAAPSAFYLRERWDLVQVARAQAAHVAQVVRGEIDESPSLWRYDASKMSERFIAEGLEHSTVRLFAADGAAVRAESAPLPRYPLWGTAPVRVEDKVAASVWVAVDQRPLIVATGWLFGASALLALLLTAILYLLPVRAIAGAERRITFLLGKLALTLQEEDRRRMARDLHDGAGQALTAARLELAALKAKGADPDAVGRITRCLDEAIDEVRRSTTALAPPALAELGLARAIERHCEAFADAAGLHVACEVAADLPPLDGEVETACYRIVQEALHNTARHAGATKAWVRLRTVDHSLRLEVGDDGSGLGETAARASGSGIEGIRERARLLGGEIEVASAAGSGVRIAVMLPARGGA
jgi:two-component system sensor histidine kinase UhpB